MSIRRKFSNTPDLVPPLESTILCEYYLWVRWCNIREINGYYIYAGMKGNKLSFVHQQNSNLTIYFHTIANDIHNNTHSNDNYSFFQSSHPYFIAQPSIPENRDINDHEIKLNNTNTAMHTPSHSNSLSNSSTPVSSPPQSPRNTYKDKNPRLTPKSSMDEYLYNHWVIKHQNHILYHTKDTNHCQSIESEYPPSYGWKYNEKNASNLPKQYNLINFGAPPPGITRIPIIPEPMITFDTKEDRNGVYAHGSFKNGGNLAEKRSSLLVSDQNSVFGFVPVHYIDLVFSKDGNTNASHALPFAVDIANVNYANVLHITDIENGSVAYKYGLKQGDILISLNEEEIVSIDNTLEKLEQYSNSSEEHTIHMTVCRRIYDHLMIIVNGCSDSVCNGKYYFHHIGEFNSPVFMQDMAQNNRDSTAMEYKLNEDRDTDESNKYPMIIRKAHYVSETGESLWTISDKNEDFYVGLSIDIMPPNQNWESVSTNVNNLTNAQSPPTLIFYNGNQKMKATQNSEVSSYELPTNKAELLESFAPPSKSYVSPANSGQISSTHYRKPSWKKHQTPWDMDMDLIIEDEEIDNNLNNEWKNKYFELYENIQDLNVHFYEYWQLCRKQKTEIEHLKDTISQHRNRFIIVRKELFQQKRREEDLLDKINSLQTHSRQVSSISALFDDNYQLDIEELQELHASGIENDENEGIVNDEIAEKKRRDSVKNINAKLDRISLETEITDLKVQLQAKDVKIRELEIDISSWQETHSQIYDSFTSATKLYREQVQKFQENEKYYLENNNELSRELEVLREQIKTLSNTNQKTRLSNDMSIEIDIETRERTYIDIDAELEFNSDSSSDASDMDSDDSIGGGSHNTHVRRGSKPWMQIKQKFDKKRAKEKQKNTDIKSEKALHTLARIASQPHTPNTPMSPVTPLSNGSQSPRPTMANKKKKSKNMLLSPRDDTKQNPFLNTIVSQQEDDSANSANSVPLLQTPDALTPDMSVMTVESIDMHSKNSSIDGGNVSHRTSRLAKLGLHSMNKMDSMNSEITLDTEMMITPDDDGNMHYQTLSQAGIPIAPMLATHKARSRLGDSILNGYNPERMSGFSQSMPGQPMLHSNLAHSHLGQSMNLTAKMNLLAFRDSNASALSIGMNGEWANETNPNISESNAMAMAEREKWENKCKELEQLNAEIINSKITLLNNTCYEISRLKDIINVVLNSNNRDVKEIITQMLKSK